jgi:hypothetical protein
MSASRAGSTPGQHRAAALVGILRRNDKTFVSHWLAGSVPRDP